jgi:hypothetical protein
VRLPPRLPALPYRVTGRYAYRTEKPRKVSTNVNDLRCHKHDVPLVPNGQGDWECEQSSDGEGVCDKLTLVDILNMVNENRNVAFLKVGISAP